VGDSDTVQFIQTEHHYANSPAAAVHAALHAGTDLESWCDGGNSDPDYYRDVLPAMLRNGSLTAALVDVSLGRLLTLRFRAGLFDDPADQPFARITPQDRGTAQQAAIALDTARQSMTLLLNRKTALPLSAGQRIAVIGPYAAYTEIRAGWTASVVDEIRRLNVGGNTTTAPGCSVHGTDRRAFAAALTTAAAADVVGWLFRGSVQFVCVDGTAQFPLPPSRCCG